MMSKPRVIKKYELLDEKIIEQIKETYPNGFDKHLIIFKNHKGELISALPFETVEYYYLIRMTRSEAQDIAAEDEGNDEGNIEMKDALNEDLSKLQNEESDVDND